MSAPATTRNDAVPDVVFWPEYLHFKRCGLSDTRIAERLHMTPLALEQRLRRAETEPSYYAARSAPLDLAIETAESIAIAIHDAAFTPEELKDWIAFRNVHQPSLMSQVVMILAAWTPKDDDVREANVQETIADRDLRTELVEVCIGCGRQMAPKRHSTELGVLQKGSEGRCSSCTYQVRRAAQKRSEAGA